MTLTRQELESKLWQAADILRGQIDAADYKNYIFSILFLKRLSDRFDEEVENAVAHGVAREVALTDRDEHGVLRPEGGGLVRPHQRINEPGRGSQRGQPRHRGCQHPQIGRRVGRHKLERRIEAGESCQP